VETPPIGSRSHVREGLGSNVPLPKGTNSNRLSGHQSLGSDSIGSKKELANSPTYNHNDIGSRSPENPKRLPGELPEWARGTIIGLGALTAFVIVGLLVDSAFSLSSSLNNKEIT